MNVRHALGPLILLYWQLGPLPRAATDDAGRVRWSLSTMAGAGTWEDAAFDCQGNVVDAEAVPFRDVGARADVLDPRSGAHVAVAASTQHERRAQSSYPGSYATVTGGMQVGWEARSVGLGAGFVRLPDHTTAPSLTMRVGPTDQVHLRFDVRPLSETPSLAGDARFGVGFRGGFAGLALSRYAEEFSQSAAFVDLALPMSRRVDLRVAGNFGPGERVAQWGLAAGVRVHQ